MTFDADSIIIPDHALQRWCERRGKIDPDGAEASLRAVLRRCQHKNPPLHVDLEHGARRRYIHGEWVFVLDADGSVVRTVLRKKRGGVRAVDRNRNCRNRRRHGRL